MSGRGAGRFYSGHVKDAPHYRFVRLKIRDLSSEGDIPGCGVVHVRLPPRYEHVPLFHKHTKEWLLILKGTGKGKIGRRVVRFKPGVFVYMPPGTVHQMSTGTGPLEALVIFSPPMDARSGRADICYPA